MPKENIVPAIAYVYDKDGIQIDEGMPFAVKATPEDGSSHMTPGMEIVWNRSGWVQIGVDIPREWILAKAKELEAIPDITATAIYADVSRFQANKLIAIMRRARNAAFGADE